MPFCKRIIAPKDVCKEDSERQGVIFTELGDVCVFALCSILRQLSDLSRQSVSILEELEGELASVCLRSRTLASKVVSLRKHLSVLVIKPPPLNTTNLDSESKRAGHFRSSWQQHVNVLGWRSRPDCVLGLHGDAQPNLQRLLQEFGEQLDNDTEHWRPGSQGSEGTPESPDSPAPFGHEAPDPACLVISERGFWDRVPDRDWSGSCEERPRTGPPVPEKPRWLLGPVTSGEGVSQPGNLPLSPAPAGGCLPLREASGGREMVDNMALAFSSWNGPRGSTFCPNWDSSFSPYLLNPDPVTVAIAPRGRAAPSEEAHYRERSFSVPADAGSFSPGGRGYGGGGGAEEAGGGVTEAGGGTPIRPTARAATPTARSISLRKLKKKPLPPERSVSLGATARGHAHSRPRSLCLLGSAPPDVVLSTRPRPSLPDTPPSRAGTGAAAGGAEPSLPSQSKCGSAESLPSPQTSPSRLSPEAKPTSPLQPPRLLSPSSGYSSLPDTPTPPAVPTAAILGPSPLGCRMRPRVPERKSSLTPASARERAARLRLSCEVPASSRPDPAPGGATKPPAARRHSDSSPCAVAAALAPRLSPRQVAMLLVTETDLRSVRLRTVGLPDPEGGPEGGSQAIPEEQDQDPAPKSPVRAPNPRPKPPIAAKPVLPKRPLSLILSPTPPPQSPPTSPASPEHRPRPLPKRPLSLMLSPAPSLAPLDPPPSEPVAHPSPLGNIYRVLKKRKSKKSLVSAALPGPGGPQECAQPPLDPEREAKSPAAPADPETRDRTRTLPSRMTISCLAELDRKQGKVPPPVPRKPSVLLLPVNGVCGGALTERANGANNANGAQALRDVEAETARGMDPSAKMPGDAGIELSQDCPEEDYDDVFVGNSTSHTTEDLFTIIHRSKRKVLGRKEPSDLFGSRQSLSSPGKAEGGAGGGSRSSSRNDTFMAMLQKRNGRNGPTARPTAAEMLQSTNPLTRRPTDCPPPYPESTAAGGPKAPPQY